ncbi:hypothetical protein NFI96_011167, partial [Prochilodus magdalenae]
GLKMVVNAKTSRTKEIIIRLTKPKAFILKPVHRTPIKGPAPTVGPQTASCIFQSAHPENKGPSMTPSILSTSSPSYSSPMTVAQRKEANELRKTLKPLMEKRRRARINDSLNKLKTLIVPLVGKDNSRYSKLEKADVLEMTVRFLRELPSSPAKDQADSYRDGYKACLQRVSALLPHTSLDRETGLRVSDFMQQAMRSPSPSCQHCCGHSASTAPQTQQRLRNLQANAPRLQATSSIATPAPSRPQQQPQAIINNMWRPW